MHFSAAAMGLTPAKGTESLGSWCGNGKNEEKTA
jgi:hypothetical protein